jgi:hypothetical protein
MLPTWRWCRAQGASDPLWLRNDGPRSRTTTRTAESRKDGASKEGRPHPNAAAVRGNDSVTELTRRAKELGLSGVVGTMRPLIEPPRPAAMNTSGPTPPSGDSNHASFNGTGNPSPEFAGARELPTQTGLDPVRRSG